MRCVCGETFQRKVTLALHINDHTFPIDCTICASRNIDIIKLNSSDEILSHLKEHVSRSANANICETCGKSYKNRYCLMQHQLSHSNEKKYECNICFQKFVYAASIRRHKLNIHSQIKRYKCEICDKVYSTASALKDHAYVHNGQPKPYFCQICNKDFHHPSQLKIHMSRHTGERINCKICKKSFPSTVKYQVHSCVRALKPYSCSSCGTLFKLQANLMNHKCGNKTTYGCIECDKVFRSAQAARQHYRVHANDEDKTWEECDICHKKVSTPAVLTKHRKIHTEEPKNICDICGKAFRARDALKVHRRIHTGEKPYACTFENCNKRFSDPSTYINHKKRHK